ncbi:MAG: hypothetical protein WBW69_19575 [Candidatus Korobacteraceae bacterium]
MALQDSQGYHPQSGYRTTSVFAARCPSNVTAGTLNADIPAIASALATDSPVARQSGYTVGSWPSLGVRAEASGLQH